MKLGAGNNYRWGSRALGIVVTGLGLQALMPSFSTAAAISANKVIVPAVASPKSPFVPISEIINGLEGNKYVGPVAAFKAGASSKASDFYAIITWGDGSKSVGAIVSDGGGKYHVAGVHTYLEDGKYITSVKITESTVGSVVAKGIAQVADAPLVGTSKETITVKANKSFSGVIGTFDDRDPFNTRPKNYTGIVKWGDGTSSSVTFVRAGNGHWTILGNHKYSKPGNYTATVTVRDVDGAGPITDTAKITVK